MGSRSMEIQKRRGRVLVRRLLAQTGNPMGLYVEQATYWFRYASCMGSPHGLFFSRMASRIRPTVESSMATSSLSVQSDPPGWLCEEQRVRCRISMEKDSIELQNSLGERWTMATKCSTGSVGQFIVECLKRPLEIPEQSTISISPKKFHFGGLHGICRICSLAGYWVEFWRRKRHSPGIRGIRFR